MGQILQFGKSLAKFADRCGPDASCLVGRKEVAWLGAEAGNVSYGFTTPAGVTASVVLAHPHRRGRERVQRDPGPVGTVQMLKAP